MGSIWTGLHVKQRLPVAIKVITDRQALNANYQQAFLNEVRAAAGLNHPGIVTVLDYGTVDARAAAQSEDELLEGSPYLAMELAEYGSLRPWAAEGLRHFADLRLILLALLDALAHAHARGVIHRDIKPANILLGEAREGWPGIKLSDFGLAFATERLENTSMVFGAAGTPHYMAPEQLRGRWRDYGPWTDLYALGCVAFELASGRLPFEGNNVVQVARAHLEGAPLALRPNIAVPPDFERWLRRLLERNINARFASAAEAARSLLELGMPDEPPPARPWTAMLRERGSLAESIGDAQSLGPSDSQTTPLHVLDHLELDPRELEELSDALSAASRGPHVNVEPVNSEPDDSERDDVDADRNGADHQINTPIERVRCRVPERWGRDVVTPGSVRLLGAGLGLYGLRRIPIVGRTHERDTLWQALHEADAEKAPRAVVLQGPPGVGKSFLAKWLVERASELGAATPLHAMHSPVQGPGDGLGRMLARHLGCIDLGLAAAEERVRTLVAPLGVENPYEWEALAAMAMPFEGEAAARQVVFTDPKHRYSIIRRHLERLGRSRPVILWFDDVQWASDALGFAQFLLETPSTTALPVLLVLTARDDLLAENDHPRSQLARLAEHDATRVLTVPPLPSREHSTLVEQLLFLDRELAFEVTRRSAGNPLFAVQLVGDWVQRRVLEVGEQGFVLGRGVQAHVPDALHEVWSRAVNRLVASGPFNDLIALELAATLGQHVDHAEWAAVCTLAGIEVPRGLVNRLIERRLAYGDERNWVFAHSMVRESIERTAREQGRLRVHNKLCARMIEQLPPNTHYRAERLAFHLLEANELQAALEPLLDGARKRRELGELAEAQHLLAHLERTIAACKDVLDAQSHTRYLTKHHLMMAHISANLWQPRPSFEWAQKAVDVARRSDNETLLARGYHILGIASGWLGEFDRAHELLDAAREGFERVDDRYWLASCCLSEAQILRRRGQYDACSERLARAHTLLVEQGDEVRLANVLHEMAMLVMVHRGEYEEARKLATRALQLARDNKSLLGSAECLVMLAEVCRLQDDLDEAERLYHEASEQFVLLGRNNVVTTFNLAQIQLRRGRYEDAHALFERVSFDARATQRRVFVACACVALLVCAAAARDWDMWDRNFEEGTELLDALELVEPDLGQLAEQAAELAEAAGEGARAARARRLAQKHQPAVVHH